jgi:hypothetical protein
MASKEERSHRIDRNGGSRCYVKDYKLWTAFFAEGPERGLRGRFTG